MSTEFGAMLLTAIAILGVVATIAWLATRNPPDGPVSAHGAPITAIRFIDTPGGRVSLGDTWDDALPKLKTGERVRFGFVDQDSTLSVYRFSADPDDVEIRFERPRAGEPVGPYRLQGFRRVPR